MLASCVLAALGCAQGAAGSKKNQAATAGEANDGKAKVVVGKKAFEGGAESLGAWLLYGAAKLDLFEKHPPPPTNGSADDFDLELGARTAQSQFWEEQRAKGGAARPIFDRQVEIWRAGFLPELVVAIHGRPGWTIPGKDLAALRLEEFAKKFTGEYEPGGPVAVEPPSGKVWPDVPGADFPDPEGLPYGAESCGRAQSARAAAWRRWEALEPRLPAPPVSAERSLDFGRQVIALQRDPQRAARGVTWVSPRVGYLAMLEGFCAIEAQDWPRAQGFLSRAIALLPAEPNGRLELSMALLHLGRIDEALAQTDTVLKTSDDGCAVAAAWRRRGYLLIDLGELGPAKAAYQKSLALEPGNAIAEHELRLIESGSAKAGAAAREKKGFVPPPPGDVIVTSCNRNGSTAR